MAAGFKVCKDGLKSDMSDVLAGNLFGAAVGLFTTDITPAVTDVLATYTGSEAAWTGYARQDPSPWSTPVIDASNRAVIYSQLLSFTVTTGGTGVTVYGYFVTKGGLLHHAQRLTTTIAVVNGTPVSLLIQYRGSNE